MRQRPRAMIVAATTALSAASLFAPPAYADAIDGDWCYGAAHFFIEGNNIVTPGRNRIQGRYSRYSFAYVIPANEVGAESEVTMVMIRGQEIVHLNRAGQTGAPEVWRRCKPIS